MADRNKEALLEVKPVERAVAGETGLFLLVLTWFYAFTSSRSVSVASLCLCLRLKVSCG